jgi:hypothetical protein
MLYFHGTQWFITVFTKPYSVHLYTEFGASGVDMTTVSQAKSKRA